MSNKALKIVEEEFNSLCEVFPHCMQPDPHRQIATVLVHDLIRRIKSRIKTECGSNKKSNKITRSVTNLNCYDYSSE